MFRPSKRIIASAALLICILSGCATPSQQAAQNIDDGYQAALTKQKACLDTLYKSPDAAALSKYRTSPGKHYIEFDHDYASDAEIQALKATDPGRHECTRAFREEITATLPDVADSFEVGEIEGDRLMRKLESRRIVWIDYINEQRQIDAETANRVLGAFQLVADQYGQSIQDELAMRQQVIDGVTSFIENPALMQTLSHMGCTPCAAIGALMPGQGR
jgi:hypothetical protein